MKKLILGLCLIIIMGCNPGKNNGTVDTSGENGNGNGNTNQGVVYPSDFDASWFKCYVIQPSYKDDNIVWGAALAGLYTGNTEYNIPMFSINLDTSYHRNDLFFVHLGIHNNRLFISEPKRKSDIGPIIPLVGDGIPLITELDPILPYLINGYNMFHAHEDNPNGVDHWHRNGHIQLLAGPAPLGYKRLTLTTNEGSNAVFSRDFNLIPASGNVQYQIIGSIEGLQEIKEIGMDHFPHQNNGQ